MANGSKVDIETPEIGSDGDCENIISMFDGDANDALNSMEEKDYQEALESIQDLQSNVNAVHAYLTEKVKSNG